MTAFDPSNLPGGSIDPLGFEQGYLWLADKILPGMTVAASCPRYYSLLCAGALLAGDLQGMPEIRQREQRQEFIRRLERLWTLAHALAADGTERELAGLRGVTYAQRRLEWLKERGRDRSSVDFKLLSRQTAYGVLGIYGNVAERVKLVYSQTLEPVPSLGEPLGESFMMETELPASVRQAVEDDRKEAHLEDLRAWGKRAWLWERPKSEERRMLRDALQTDSVRTRFCDLLLKVPAQDDEPELLRLKRISRKIQCQNEHKDIWEAVEAVVRYEDCYRQALLIFNRILWLCRTVPGGSLDAAALKRDEVIKAASPILAEAVISWGEHMEGATSVFLKEGRDPIHHVMAFLATLVGGCGDPLLLAEAVLARHEDVQRGKLNRGRRKMPWIQRDGDRLSLSQTSIGGLDFEPTEPADITPHYYRVESAENWMRAAGLT